MQRLMTATSAGLTMSPELWRRLNWMWIGFFALLGTINLAVFQSVDEATWVKFKLYGLIGLTFAFIVAQGFWIAAKAKHDDAATN